MLTRLLFRFFDIDFGTLHGAALKKITADEVSMFKIEGEYYTEINYHIPQPTSSVNENTGRSTRSTPCAIGFVNDRKKQ